MIGRTNVALTRRALMIDADLALPGTAGGRAVHGIADELRARGIDVVESTSAEDGIAVFSSDAALHCVLVDWNIDFADQKGERPCAALLRHLRERNDQVPVFLMAERVAKQSITVEVMQLADEFIWKGIPPGVQFDAMVFDLQGNTGNAADERMFIGNIRIANN